MPRQFLRRVLPHPANLKKQWFLRPFRALLHDPALWATHRRNVLRALGLGIFISFIPFPIHTALAGITALYLRLNVPVAIVASWLSNPITFGPMYYGASQLGAAVLGSPAAASRSEFSMEPLQALLGEIWPPLLVGCLIAGTTLSLATYWILNRLWIRQVRRRFQRRRDVAGQDRQA